MKKIVLGTLSLVFLAIAVVVSIVLISNAWQISRDIDGWKDRAQVSMEPNDMADYMTNVKVGMEKWEMTSGNAAWLFPTPGSDMALIYKAVIQHIDTAKSLAELDRSSDAYANGLDNLRGGIREIDLHDFQYWANHQGGFAQFSFWVGWIAFIFFGLWWLFTNSY
jgi:hypothetical protein